MFHPPSGDVLATAEHMLLHVNTKKKRLVHLEKFFTKNLHKFGMDIKI